MQRTGVTRRERFRGAGRRRDGSVLGRVGVAPGVGTPPGHQLERQIAVMVREGRLAPGRELPSTRRLATRAGVHRNTVAAAYRRLGGRGLVEVRHGARVRVAPASGGEGGSTPGDPGPDRGATPGPAAEVPTVPGLWTAAAHRATAVLMAAEVAAALPADVSAEPPHVASLAVALPGAPCRPPEAGAADPVRARQDRRPEIVRLLRSAPPLSVVALLTSCPALLEAVRSDVVRLRGDAVTLRAVSPCDADPPASAVRRADRVIADRIEGKALLDSRPAGRHRTVRAVRLLDRRTIAAVRRRFAGSDDTPSRFREAAS